MNGDKDKFFEEVMEDAAEEIAELPKNMTRGNKTIMLAIRTERRDRKESNIIMVEALEKLTAAVEELTTKLTANPVVRIGAFMGENKKLSMLGGIGTLFLVNLWFIDSFREGVLIWLKVPQQIIDLFIGN